MWKRNVFEEVEKEIKQMIREDKCIRIDIKVKEMARYKKISEHEAEEIALKIVDQFYDNVRMEGNQMRMVE